ncbi:hypothetical protein LCGC14_1001630 [marine sediment metagenome]|uniref:DOD-type homing endonuclease domain-containing protein n=1 Tax=marine sediment metagenome TaxID=412755 RepID=A0A0F9N7L2_9ZZZZ
MKKQLVIIGGGDSLTEPVSQGLWSKLEGRYTIGLNYNYIHFNSTCLMGVDDEFYNGEGERLESLPLIVFGFDKDVKKYYPNTIVLKTNNKYTRDLSNKVYKSQLTGLFSLTLGIYLLDVGEIFLCYDKKTEVFTNEGWKYFKDLKGNELILTRKANGETEWSKILAKQKYYYEGKMYSIKSKGIDLVVTPDHQFCLISNKKYKSKYCSFYPSKDGYIWRTIPEMTSSGSHFIPKVFKWRAKRAKYFTLFSVNQTNKNDYNSNITQKIKMRDWLRFLGLYLSEGCVFKNLFSIYGITIYQNHNKKTDVYIEKILQKLPFNYIKTKRGWNIYSKSLYMYLKPLGLSKNKYIPNEIKQLCGRQLKILLELLIFGDGWKGKKREFYYFTASKQLADDVQEIAYKCGYNAEIYWRKGRKCSISPKPKIGLPQWTVYFNNSKKQGNLEKIVVGNLIYKNKIKKINYKDYVYDVTVKNHTLWIRRNNKCVWSGNCGFDNGGNKNKIINKQYATHYYHGEIEHRGIGHCGYYDIIGKAEKDFGVYKNETKVRIYNVVGDPESKIPTFEKIDYKTFYAKLDNNFYDQDKLRTEIKNKLGGQNERKDKNS